MKGNAACYIKAVMYEKHQANAEKKREDLLLDVPISSALQYAQSLYIFNNNVQKSSDLYSFCIESASSGA